MAKLQEKNGQYSVTLSKARVEMHGWKKGDEIIDNSDQFKKDIVLTKK
jgi:hypothetical protein